MLKNYLILAWRTLLRNKLHSSISIIGLSIGISACLVIFLIVNYEFSFDKFEKDRDRIYRVYSEFSGDFKGLNHGVPAAMAGTLRQELTGWESMTGFHTWSAKVHLVDGKNDKKDFETQRGLAFAGPEYFEVFNDYEWLAGTPATALAKPFQVVLTESKAKLYFGTDDVLKTIGRELHYQDSLIVTVTGIVKDLPHHSDLMFKDFISLATINATWLKKGTRFDDWDGTNSSSQFFVKLLPGTSVAATKANIAKIATAHKNRKDVNWIVTYHLQPFADIHFNAAIGIFDNSTSPADLPTLRMLIIIAVLLLAIAAINFINLETAQSVRRAKEVGLRKVMGSTRGKLIFHFLLQSTLLTVFAAVVAMPISKGAIYFFKDFIPAGLQLNFADPLVIGFIFCAIIVVSFLAGLYPAFSLSSFLPALALKNQITSGNHQSRTGVIRKALIIFQFTFAQALILATLIVGWQISYMLNKDLGFSKEAVIYLDTPWRETHSKAVAFKTELERLPEIKGISLCADVPASQGYSSSSFKYNNGKEELHHNVYRKYGDTAFISVFDLHLLAGRNIHRSDSADEYIINQTYAKMLGFLKPEDAIDKILISDEKRYPIVGVVKDFNFQSLRSEIQPIIIADEEYNFNTIGMKLGAVEGGKSIKDLTAKIEAIWKRIYPDEKFELLFLDQKIAQFYEKEQRINKLVKTATGVAILISCLGLFGLASLTSMQRTKEVGIRKVLGASVNNLVLLLSKEFIVLVLIAFVIAAPISFYVANGWLAQFAYRTTIGWQVFFWTVLASVGIALLSVSYQAIKAAAADPVKSLRYE